MCQLIDAERVALGSKEFEQLANLGVIRPNRVRAAVGFKL